MWRAEWETNYEPPETILPQSMCNHAVTWGVFFWSKVHRNRWDILMKSPGRTNTDVQHPNNLSGKLRMNSTSQDTHCV